MVPGGQYALDVANEALRRRRERKIEERLLDEVRKAAALPKAEAKAVAKEVAAEVLPPDARPEERQALELYLSQIPEATRHSLRRSRNPDALRLDTPEAVAEFLPAQMPRFLPDMLVPGRPERRLVELLGTGGFGEVWLAERIDGIVQPPWAVKFFTHPDARARLTEHEGKLINRVETESQKAGGHPNIVLLREAKLDGETPWLAYEYVGGGDLTGVIAGWQSLEPAARVKEATAALLLLARAVGRFHRLTPPIVHRDLKPANVLWDAEAKQLKVTDFGIGGVVADHAQDGAEPVIEDPTILAGAGTLIYASPQQQRGEDADPRDDVHALGILGYQMFTGKPDQQPGLRFDRELAKLGVPSGLADLLSDCVDANPAARPRDATELAERLEKATAPPPAAPPAPAPKPAPTPPAPSGTDPGLVVLGILGGVFGIALLIFLGTSIRRSVDPGTHERTLRGHTDEVNYAEFSPDGLKAVTASRDGTAKIWEVKTGTVLHTLKGHTGWVNSARFSRDGGRVVTSSGDHTVRVWDANKGIQTLVINKPANPTHFAEFSPDGTQILATVPDDNAAVIWSAGSGTEIATIKESYLPGIGYATFAPNGKTILTTGRSEVRNNAPAKLWVIDGTSPKVEKTFDGSVSEQARAAFSRDGSRVVVPTADKTAKVFDVATGKVVHTLDPHPGAVHWVTFGRNENWPLTVNVESGDPDFLPSYKTQNFWMWNLQEQGRVWKVDDLYFGHKDNVYTVMVSPDGTKAITASKDKTARIWTLP